MVIAVGTVGTWFLILLCFSMGAAIGSGLFEHIVLVRRDDIICSFKYDGFGSLVVSNTTCAVWSSVLARPKIF